MAKLFSGKLLASSSAKFDGRVSLKRQGSNFLMIKRFGSSERKSKFENANKGLTRLAGRQADFETKNGVTGLDSDTQQKKTKEKWHSWL